jgi:putative membrane-bound dehydrogenase-like protein
VLALLAAALPSRAQKEYGFDNRKPSGQPYLTPEESLRRMKVAEGFEVKLFAAEPDVVNPIAFTIDERGRVWAVESFEYPKRTAKGQKPRDRIVILEDTDGDGKVDKRTVFAEGKDFPVPFDMASGIEVGYGGVFLGAPPYLFFIENKNDRPGKIEILLKGFGSQDTHETLNTFQWGPDGWLYGLQGVFTHSSVKPGEPGESGASAPGGAPVELTAGVWRYHPVTKKFELFAEGTSNPWGMDFDDNGQCFLGCCVIPHLFHIVPGGIYKRQAGQSQNPYAYGYLNEICDHTFHKESGWAHAGLLYLTGPTIPEQYRGSVIFGSIHGCSIKRNTLRRNGSTFTASRADDFLQSGDKNFRPVNLRWGPNGDIFVSDWHDQNPCHQAAPDSWDYEHGRIYRIQPKGMQTKRAEDLGKKGAEEFVGLLRSENPYHYRMALRLIAERIGEPQFINTVWHAIGSALVNRTLPHKCHVDWALEAILDPRADRSWANKLESEKSALARETPAGARANAESRAWVYRMFGNSPSSDPRDFNRLADLAELEPEPTARLALACTALRIAHNPRSLVLIHALLQRKEDSKDPVIPQILWLAYEKHLAGAAREELKWLGGSAAGNELITGTIVPRSMRRLVATGRREDLAACVAFLVELDDTTVRRQALEGLALALQNRQVDEPAGWRAVQASLVKSDDPDTRRLVDRLSVSFRDREALARALKIAADRSKSAADRLQAVRDLALGRLPEAMPVLRRLLTEDGQLDLRAEAARALGGYDRPELAREVIADWPKYPPRLRGEVVSVLAGRRDWARDLLDAVGRKAVARTDLTDNTILRMRAFKDNKLNQQIETVWGKVRDTPAELNALIDRMRNELYAGPASFARGRLVFENQCAKCHKFEGRGHEVGPPLDGAARDIEYLLANILDPNRVVGAPYFLRTVELKSGRVEQGLLAGEDDQSVTLKGENDALRVIPRKEIESITVLERSVMPEGLANNMTVQDFRDLIRYVMVNPFITNVELSDAKRTDIVHLAVGAPGRIPLSATQSGRNTITASVTAPAELRSRLLIGAVAPLTVTLNGTEVYKGRPGTESSQPDQAGVDVTLRPGENTVVIRLTEPVRADTAVYARFLDPDRKLSYPEK